jgi:predicted dehydrogenase
MLKVAFIGAGRRAQSAHYPCIPRLADVRLEAVAELDADRAQTVASQYGIPRVFTDYHEMLATVNPDAVYVIMGPDHMAKPAIDCMDAGKPVFIEKPAGGNADESRQLLEAAERNKVHCMVAYQRRYTAVTREAMRLVRERGPATLAIGEFHKPGDPNRDVMDQLWADVCHVTDLVRFMIGSEPVEVTAYQDAHEGGGKNCFNGLIRFANKAVGIVTASRTSGGRYLRSELHGLGIGCYMRLPEEIEILDRGQAPRVLSGAQVAGADEKDIPRYEGVLSMHEHFVECVRNGNTPCSDIRDVIYTSRLVERLAVGK